MTYDCVGPRPDALVAAPIEEPPPVLPTPVEEPPPPRPEPVKQKTTPRKAPLRHAQSFLICRKVRKNKSTDNVSIIDPFGGIRLTVFPSLFRMSLFAQLTGGHGVYQLALGLHDDEDEVPWSWAWSKPVRYTDPLAPYRVILRNAEILFPRPGRYALLLLANGEEVARHVIEVREALLDEFE